MYSSAARTTPSAHKRCCGMCRRPVTTLTHPILSSPLQVQTTPRTLHENASPPRACREKAPFQRARFNRPHLWYVCSRQQDHSHRVITFMLRECGLCTNEDQTASELGEISACGHPAALGEKTQRREDDWRARGWTQDSGASSTNDRNVSR